MANTLYYAEGLGNAQVVHLHSSIARLINRSRAQAAVPFSSRYRDHSYDPTRPAQGYRAGLQELLAIAEIKVRRYDFRHHAVSRALSNPLVPLEAAKAYFGWMSPKMVQRYYHANPAAMRVVAAALDEKPPEPTKSTKSRRKAAVVEIQTNAIAARGNCLCLPPSSEEDQ